MIDFVNRELEEIKREGLYRSLRCVEGHQGPRVTIDGKECVNLCSNNYLGLANNPKMKQAAIEAIQKYGCGTGADDYVEKPCDSDQIKSIVLNLLLRFKR